MTAFKDILFPTQVSFHARGGPRFLTNVVVMNSGKESRDQVWSLSRGEWEVSFDARMVNVWEPLKAFFRVVRGQAYSFRFKDWSDYQADATEGFFVMLTSTTFQTWKRFEYQGETYEHKITKLDGAPTITGGTSPVANLATGVVTVAGGTPLTWEGKYHYHVRLHSDHQELEIINKNIARGLIVGWQNIELFEEKD